MPIKVLHNDLPELIWPHKFAKPAVQIKISFEELCDALKINYFIDEDDLDVYKGAVIYATRLGPITFQEYQNAPEKTTVVYGDIMCSSRKIAQMLIDEYGVLKENISWVAEN